MTTTQCWCPSNSVVRIFSDWELSDISLLFLFNSVVRLINFENRQMETDAHMMSQQYAQAPQPTQIQHPPAPQSSTFYYPQLV